MLKDKIQQDIISIKEIFLHEIVDYKFLSLLAIFIVIPILITIGLEFYIWVNL